MTDGDRHKDTIPPEIQEVIHALVSSMRATRLYPANNPVHQQAIQKSFDALDRHLRTNPAFVLAVQKTDFAYDQTPAGRDMHLYRNIANDLFVKGVREIAFKQGVTREELQRFFDVIAIPLEKLRQKDTIRSLIWEQNLPHVAVTEAELAEMETEEYGARADAGTRDGEPLGPAELRKRVAGKVIDLFGRKVLLTQVIDDPGSFGAMMVEIANKSGDAPALRENRLFDLYRDAGRQILHTTFGERRPLFDALAESVLNLDPPYRDGMVVRKLYHGLDAETVRARKDTLPEHLPDDLHELLSARFSKSWTVPQVSALIEKAAAAQFEPVAAAPERPQLPEDLLAVARELSEYTLEEMESLRALADHTTESAVAEAVVRTLISVLPQVKNPFIAGSPEKNMNLFSGVVGQLEEMLSLLLEKKDYALALLILRSFRIPVEPLFQSRLHDALKRAGDRKIVARLLDDARTHAKDSPEYGAIHSYLSLLGREVTPVLLEMLAEEQDRSLRNLMIRILKELGKTQLALLGERLSDERWYFVRNIVTIMGESRREEVVGYLERVADHRNFQIRQEVVRALLMIKGERAVRLLIRFLRDRDVDIRFMAVRGLGLSLGSGAKEEQALIEFLKSAWYRRIDPELKAEAVASLGKVGGKKAAAFLGKHATIRWWKPRKPQETVRAAAEKAIAEIKRRLGDAGRTK